MAQKTIFLTGAAGFIGMHTALQLKARGDVVIGFDNFCSYYNPSLKRDRAKILKDNGINIYEGDLTDSCALQKRASGATHILHLAAQAGVRYSIENPKAYVDANLVGFSNILELARLFNLPLVYASSSSVYGANIKLPFSVEDPTDKPINFYGATKKANELMAYSYHHLYGLPCTGLRFFTVYGPWGRPDMACYSFTKAIIEQVPIKLYNMGKMKRDFTYIDDIVAGTLGALDYMGGARVYNLGNHKSEELLYFIDILEKSVGKRALIEKLPMQMGEMRETFADIEPAKKELGFSPRISLAEGLPLFVKWYKEYHSA